MPIRNFSEKTLTAEVLKRVGKAPDKRTRQVMQSLVKHLHAFVREVRPTQEEWFQGIQFLTKTGHMCDDQRQEFILMSDTLGVSMLVDFINYGKTGKATESTVLGPFFVEGAPDLPPTRTLSRAGRVPRVTAIMIMPGVQMPHCAPISSMNARWRGCASPRPSIVTIAVPPTCANGTRQLHTAAPSRSTVQAPHSPSPHPSFVPVNPHSSRSTSSSRFMGGASTSTGAPFRVNCTPPP
jgi:hypothetical protein